jgi:hypothetical protein
MAKKKKAKWIQGAIKKPGALTASAKAAGKSPMAFAREKAGAGGVTGRRARLALTLRKLGKRRRGRQYRR